MSVKSIMKAIPLASALLLLASAGYSQVELPASDAPLAEALPQEGGPDGTENSEISSTGQPVDTPVLANKINFVSTREMTVDVACRMLSYASGHNITPTAEASESVCSFLFRNGTIEQALDSLSVASGLVYRKNPTHSGYQVMTIEEFRKNNIFTADEEIAVFTVEPANVELIAEAVEALFPNEVIYEQPTGILDMSSTSANGSSGNGNFDGGGGFNNRSSRSGGMNFRSVNGTGGGFGNSGFGGGMQEPRKESQVTQLQALSATTNEKEAKEPAGRSIYITVNLESNQVIVRTSNLPALEKIRALVEKLDLPVKQVVLEMQILELDVGDGKTVGVDWALEAGPQRGPVDRQHTLGAGNFATEAAATFAYRFISEDFSARLQAVAANNDVEILATPMIIAANNRQAEIVVGEDRVLITGASSDTSIAGETGTRNELITLETENRNIGTTLRVIPRLNDDGTVALHVEQESSTLLRGNNSIPVAGQNVAIDSVDTATVTSDVIARSGSTIALGGLIRTENFTQVDKVPVLGDIPVIKHAFRRQSTSARKAELILLITPHIVEPGGRAPAVTSTITNRSHHHYFRGGEAALEAPNTGLQSYHQRSLHGVLPPRKSIPRAIPASPRPQPNQLRRPTSNATSESGSGTPTIMTSPNHRAIQRRVNRKD